VRTRVAWRGVVAAPRARSPRSRDASNLQRFPAKRTQGADSSTRSRVTDRRVFPTRPTPKKEIPQRTTRTLPARFFSPPNPDPEMTFRGRRESARLGRSGSCSVLGGSVNERTLKIVVSVASEKPAAAES
jgi:hypothetical protein